MTATQTESRAFQNVDRPAELKTGAGLKSFIQLLHQIHGWTAQTTQTADGWSDKQFPISNPPSDFVRLL